jgi:peptide/nickel transport system permease protein
MLRHVVRRLIAVPLLLLGVASVAFLLSHFTKGDPLASVVPERQMNNAAVVEAARKRWGLDKPLPEQYLVYLGNLLAGDMGTSFRTKREVTTDIVERLPATFELVLAAMLVGTGSGILLGVVAAHFRNRAIDHGARLYALIGSSIPVFWSGLILLFVFSVALGWLPGPGRLDARTAAPPFVTGMYTIESLLAGQFRTNGDAVYHLQLPA